MTDTRPAVQMDREAIARIVDRAADWGRLVESNSAANERMLLALAKADAILALLPAQRDEGR